MPTVTITDPAADPTQRLAFDSDHLPTPHELLNGFTLANDYVSLRFAAHELPQLVAYAVNAIHAECPTLSDPVPGGDPARVTGDLGTDAHQFA